MQGQNNDNDNPRNYYVPINDSLKVIIPVDQEIIYSTHISVRYDIKNLSKGRGKKSVIVGLLTGSIAGAVITSAMNSSFNGIYYTDVLMTKEGIALNLPTFYWYNNGTKMKRNPPSPHYKFWRNIHFPMYIGGDGPFVLNSTYICNLCHVKKYGSKQQFNIHKNKFYNDIPQLRDEYVLKYLKKAQSSVSLNNKQKEEIGQYLLKFFQAHPGNAFTKESLLKRLQDEIDNQEWLEYLEIDIRGGLNKLLFKGEIEYNRHEGRIYYFSAKSLP